MAARWRWATRAPHPARALRCICCRRCGAPSSASVWPPPASAAARARRSSSRRSPPEEDRMEGALLPVLAIVALYLFSGLRILKEYERGVLFVLGRSWGAKGPGLIWLPPVLTKMQKVSLRVIAMDIPPQDVITRANTSINVNPLPSLRRVSPANAHL